MKLLHYPPHKKLQHLVKQYWVMEFENSEQQQEEILFPIGAVEIIFHFKQPLLRLHNESWIAEEKAFIEGMQTGAIMVKQPTITKTVGITLYPWATEIFFSVSPQSFTNRRFVVSDVNVLLHDLYEELATVTFASEIATLCDHCFTRLSKNKFRFYRHSDESIFYAFKKLEESNLIDLKKDWDYSSRLFEMKFKELIGVTASELIRKKRMGNALKRMLEGGQRTFTDLCHTTGYYDQSHFIKEFRHYFNVSPRSFQKEQCLLKHFIV